MYIILAMGKLICYAANIVPQSFEENIWTMMLISLQIQAQSSSIHSSLGQVKKCTILRSRVSPLQ